MNSNRKEALFYWVLTAPFLAIMLISSMAYLFALPQVVEGLAQLGYPSYIVKILGVAKLLGVVAILYNRSPLLKEWAYAGFTFNIVGAIASHLLAGEPVTTIMGATLFLAINLSSYSLWKKRTLRVALSS